MTNFSEIHDVHVYPLNIIPVANGPVLHMLKKGSPAFTDFGEIYFSIMEARSVKAWKKHLKAIQSIAVPQGLIEVIIYDDRKKSPTFASLQKILLGYPDNYRLIRIPPDVWYGFRSLSEDPSLIANVTSIPHDPSESIKADPDSNRIPYAW